MSVTSFIDLLHNYPLLGPEYADLITSLSERILKDSAAATHFIPVEGLPEYQSIAAQWLSLPTYPVAPERIAFGVSGHHVLTSILLSQTKAGQAVACDPITYNGWINISRQTERRLVSIAGDNHGMLPGALAEAAAKEPIWGVFLMPSLHNPCTTVMPIERRQALVKVCKKHGLWIIDDDAYRFLNPEAPASFAHLYPEKSFWIQSLTKPLFPSIKTAFVVAPENCVASLNEALRGVGHQPSPLTLPWVMDLIPTQIIERLLQTKRSEAKKRQLLAKELLGPFEFQATEFSFHLWLTLSDGWTSVSANQALRNAGVGIVPGINYSTNSVDPKKIRIALAGAENLESVRRGLEIVARVLTEKT
jgi:DNA-binding transcriptional MocR family regulator